MSDPEQHVDLSSLLNVIQSLTNQVNALQNPVPLVKPVTKNGENRTIPVYAGAYDGSGAYQIARNDLTQTDASLCFAIVANSPTLSDSQQKMCLAPTTENKRYSKMEMYPDFTSKLSAAYTLGANAMDSSFNREILVAEKFNAVVSDYVKMFKPDPGVKDEISQILTKKFPTHNYFPGQKGLYESNEIFTLLDTFPKGGQLHIHSGALCDIDWVLRDGKLTNTRTDGVYTTNKIGVTYDLKDGEYALFANMSILENIIDPYAPGSDLLFKSFPVKTISGRQNVRYIPLTSTSGYNNGTNTYTDPSGVVWKDLQKGLTPEIRKKLRDSLTMGLSLQNTDIPQVWSVFELVNKRWGSLRKAGDIDLSFNIDLFASGIRYAYETKIQHIDIRFGFSFDKGFPTEGNSDAIEGTRRTYVYNVITDTCTKMRQFTEAVHKVQRDVALNNPPNNIDDFNVRFILGTPRNATAIEVEYLMTAAYMLKTGKGYPDDKGIRASVPAYPAAGKTDFTTDRAAASWKWGDTKITKTGKTSQGLDTLVVGYDLIAEEDRNNTTDFYRSAFLQTNLIEAKLDTSMNFYFHDGESNWRSNDNVVDAILLGTKRIGHGFNIDMRPGVVAKLIRENICLEICPISNQILQYTPDIRGHYANGLYRQGVPMVLSNDDPIMFGYTGLTYDFFAAAVSWGLTYKDVKRLAWSSLHYSSLTQGEQTSVKQKFGLLLDRWVTKMILRYKLTTTGKFRTSADYERLCM